MSDEALDAELRALVAVDPAPGFPARVRTRVATEPSRPERWLLWTGALSLAAAAAIVAVSIRHEPQPPTAPVRLAARTSSAVTPLMANIVPSTMVRVTRAGRTHTIGVRSVAASISPDILVDPREAAAILAFITAVQDGRIDRESLARAAAPPSLDPLPATAPLDIALIAIEPLAPAEGVEGVRQ